MLVGGVREGRGVLAKPLDWCEVVCELTSHKSLCLRWEAKKRRGDFRTAHCYLPLASLK